MVQKITFTKTAEKSFIDIATFLEENISFIAAEKFAVQVDAKIEKLKIQPFIGRPSQKAKTIRKINVNKTVQMMYRVSGRTLTVSGFFDTRQDPSKNRF